MFDMGPYYLTALVSLMGGVSEVCGMNSITFPTRTITSKPKYGQSIHVEVPTHVAGLLRFDSGAIGTIITSFDVWQSSLPRIEIYGTKGTIFVPDPNTFEGPVQMSTLDGSGFKEIPLTHPYAENSRGIGVADMAQCIINGGNNKANGELTAHVLEVMCAIARSDEDKAYYKMKTKCDKPAAMLSELIK